jgi:hypothetical protein
MLPPRGMALRQEECDKLIRPSLAFLIFCINELGRKALAVYFTYVKGNL